MVRLQLVTDGTDDLHDLLPLIDFLANKSAEFLWSSGQRRVALLRERSLHIVGIERLPRCCGQTIDDFARDTCRRRSSPMPPAIPGGR